MKKVLLATTAMALSAGVAYAEVSLSDSETSAAEVSLGGYATMGLQNDGTDTYVVNRMQFNVDASTETTSGITFGARTRVRLDAGDGGQGFSGARIYMSTGGFTVAMGNIDGAIWSIPGVWASEVGLTGLNYAGAVFNTVANSAWDDTDGFSSQGVGTNGIEVLYSGGGFSGHLSYSEDTLSGAAAATDRRVAAYGAYTMGDWTVTLAMQDSDDNDEDKTIVVVDGKVGDYGVNFAAADNNGETKIALTGSATFGATSVNAFVADEELGAELAMGLGVSYDLGGAAVVAAYEKDTAGDSLVEAGLSFSF